ncbi:sulfide/dihydroorotate dehydrogenase-like FAD/NAD-binding protein [Clostridium sp. CX1]|uniref:Sulfide/dihydroorotate dehydrogenase-like FAD/NAD-binding protein n=1 Tax=Clostridium tanneri TaxID=3037988 RepID=A0ABU4JY95_9CLOT|nr:MULTISPECIES: sulfide/dihydroorotate dehydrogenase-like FAD/NAD-binding protein [unclassified Clostridium]MCT8978645.1 sulfide/dihydroorotate dehydrogenase-like FAD/NAD-binding protein [Clostridium sp. CX1]MDW8802844.1 sulfide/dihydroorotate dehydrogenase-like FAD/NAD-binding protein [Clostridium sp. A1-XYC3]
MFKILDKKEIAPNTFLMEIEAPRIAKACLPGQFVIVKADEKSERIPLSICDYDRKKGTVTIAVEALGKSTQKIAAYDAEQGFDNFAGPLGQPSNLVHMDLEELKNKNIMLIGVGQGAASIYSQIKWLNEHEINADVIFGCKSKEYILLQEEMKAISSSLYISTEDGSYGYKGLATDLLRELVEKEGKRFDQVIAVGPVAMLKSISEVTKEYGIKTIVSLKAIMIDGMGICGGCRVTVDGETKLTCLDGPEFDGHLVDFEELIRRQGIYKTEEGHVCRVGLHEHS